ncbi:MAG: 50S ribosomal protein L25 [Bdellovibrionales bacterium]|nr:50S ribosomal protein L25 [Bdellovibrionales bacterium]
MALVTTKLNVVSRKTGKGNSRSLRSELMVPAVVYGPKTGNLNLALQEKDVVKYSTLKFENAIFELTSEDSGLNGLKVLRKETTVHPLSRRPVHVDFYAVDLNKLIRVNVELVFEGTAIGVKEGGVMNVLKHHVEVECPATAIPSSFNIDVTDLNTDHSLHVSDITNVPANVKILTPAEEAIAAISTTREEKAEEDADAAATDVKAES